MSNGDAGPDTTAEQAETDGAVTAKAESAEKSDARVPFSTILVPEEMVLVHNELVECAKEYGVKSLVVDSFDSLEEGARACETLYAKIQEAKAAEAAGAKKRKKGKDMAKTATAAKKAAPPAKKAGTKKAAAPAKTAPKADGEVRSLKYSMDSKITWVGDDGKNPFREGSGRHERTELLRKHNGKTVKTFLGNGGQTKTLAFCEEKGYCKIG